MSLPREICMIRDNSQCALFMQWLEVGENTVNGVCKRMTVLRRLSSIPCKYDKVHLFFSLALPRALVLLSNPVWFSQRWSVKLHTESQQHM